LRIDTRWSSGNRARLRKEAADLVALGPDVMVAGVGPTTLVLQQVSRTVPIVMAQAVDPVGAGFVKSMARPGTNATGFTQFEFGLSAKWLELLREIAPQVARVGVVREVEGQIGVAQWAVIGAAASPLGVELSPINVQADGETDLSHPSRTTHGGHLPSAALLFMVIVSPCVVACVGAARQRSRAGLLLARLRHRQRSSSHQCTTGESRLHISARNSPVFLT
jgi:putative ABC transport system substrate-binding protein